MMIKRYLVLTNIEGKYFVNVHLVKSMKHLITQLNINFHKSSKLIFVEKIWFINSKGKLIQQIIIEKHFT